jgi:hypothetical protein
MAVLLAMAPALASAKPRPGKPASGFRLMARSLAAITGNRIYCGLNSSKGQVCVDSTGATVAGGGFWPKGTINQYVFGSGIEVAGIIGDDANSEWRGQTSGGFFEDPKGTTENGREVQPVFNSNDPQDVAVWPKAALVPVPPDPEADLFAPALQGKVKASDVDVWWMTWEGDPAANAGRDHPLGIAVETRGLAFNTPAGNQDILYFIYTFYNITSANRADYEAHNIRSDLVDILQPLGQRFQQLNNAKFGITIPTGGYTIRDMFVTFAADMDVGDADLDFASVNIPFSLGFAYQHNFAQPSGYVFDPGIFGDPFFPGVGFVGVKYLRSPIDPATGLEVGLKLYSNTSRATAFQDPNDVVQLYRYSTGNIDPGLGDDTCNVGDVNVTHICFINGYKGSGAPADMRFFQSSGPVTIPPGGSGSVVVAYIFAPPVKTGTCPGPAACATPGNSVLPGDPTILADPVRLPSGANIVDSLTGYSGFKGDLNSNLKVDQAEIDFVPQSLLGKAVIAQTVFDTKFLQPAAPDAPQFFLVPGDNQVSVFWRVSATEDPAGGGDPYFQAVQPGPVGVPNPLFDPNYRQFDVEGYRVYRGRTDSPNTLVMLAQFDYSSIDPLHQFVDQLGVVNTVSPDGTTTCAPSLGIFTPPDPVSGFTACEAGAVVDGLQLIRTSTLGVPGPPIAYPIASPLVQVPTGQVKALLDPALAFVARSDTAVTGSAEARALGVTDLSKLTLVDGGVPFVFVDRTAQNNLRYFYAVTAFDINSIRSGPSSLESARLTKAVTPRHDASNLALSGEAKAAVFAGPGGPLDTTLAVPTLDSITGTFSGPFPPANAWDFGLAEFVTAVLSAPGQVKLTLDSIQLGSAYDFTAANYWYGATTTTIPTPQIFSVALTQDQFDAEVVNEFAFQAIKPDSALAARFDPTVPGSQFAIPGKINQTLAGNYYTSAWGRGCVNGAAGFTTSGTPVASHCDYNGPRWFDGPSPQKNETKADPNAGNQHNSAAPLPVTNFNNAGALTGVAVIHQPLAYQTLQNTWRNVHGALGAAQRAADFNVWWGDAGFVDSVVDVTHKVPVPFAADHIGGTWGFLNQTATTAPGAFDTRPGVLTLTDFGCVPPLNTFATVGAAGGLIACTAPPYQLSQTAVPGPIAHFSPTSGDAITHAVAAGPGFAMYLAGNIFMFELPGGGVVPVKGTVWSMRSYIGAIRGGHGDGGDEGGYRFSNPSKRTLSAVGASFTVDYSVTNQLAAASDANLKSVHTVPDPYYVTSGFETTNEQKIIKFVNLPADAIIRIYSLSGVLVRVLEHHSVSFGGDETWDVRNRNGQFVSSGVYFYHIEAGGARRVARMTIINFAQ